MTYICVLCYVVPKNSSREAFIETDVYTRILNNMSVITNVTNEQCTFMVLGDLNSRIGQLNDFVEFDYIDVHVDILPDDYQPDSANTTCF